MFIAFAQPAFSQNFRHFGVNDGLSQSSVYSILQDKTGYLWFGSGDGLNRFNGYEFNVYRRGMQRKHGLSNNSIRGIDEDKEGNLWIGSEKGLHKYFAGNDSVAPVSLQLNGGKNSACLVIKALPGQVIVNCRNNGVISYNIKTGHIKQLLKYGAYSDLMYFYENSIWMQTYDSLLLGQFNLETGKLTYYKMPSKNRVVGILGHPGNNLVLGTSNGIWHFNWHTKQFTQMPATQNKFISAIYADSKKCFVIGIENEGVVVYDRFWKVKYNFSSTQIKSTGQMHPLAHVRIFYEDRNGNIWAGTDDDGVYCLNYNNLKFGNYNAEGRAPLAGLFVKSLYMDVPENTLYIGTFNAGINIWNRHTGELSHIRLPSDKKAVESSENVNAIYGYDKKYLLLATDNGLFQFNKLTKQFSPVPVESELSAQPVSFKCFSASEGKIYVGANNGVYILNQGPGGAPLLKPVFNCAPSVLSIAFVKNTIYACGGNAIFTCKLGQKEVLHFPFGIKSDIKINTLCKTATGIWAGTNYGIARLDENLKLQQWVGLKEGLPNDMIYGILEDKAGNLWMSTNKGLVRYSVSLNKIFSFGLSDGCQSNEYNSGAYYLSTQGEMFFGGVNGFNYFYPINVKTDTTLPRPVLTRFVVHDVDLTATVDPNIDLKWSQNTVSAEVAALHYSNIEGIKYAYKLEGLENGFYYAGAKRNIRYSSLKPGTYTLWVKACNADGIWCPPIALKKIYIAPPVWQTWWFTSIAGIFCLLGIAFAINRISVAKYKKKLTALQRQREIDEVRQRISRDLHDDLGSALTRISILSEKVKQVVPEKSEILSLSQKLTEQSRESITNLSEIVWAVNPQHDDLESLLSYFRYYINTFFDETDIQHNIDFPDLQQPVVINPALRRNLLLVLKESLNNITKHSRATKADVSFCLNQNTFIFCVEDNGAGFITDQQMQKPASGNGLKNLGHRMQSCNCSISIQSYPGRGTRICVEGILE